MVSIQETINSIKDGINQMQHLIDTLDGGYVVESDWHIHVGKELGLNNTEYAVKSAFTCSHATIFKTIEEAESNISYYLVDGNRKPIYLGVDSAKNFFKREIENNRKLLVFIGDRK